MSNQPSLQSLFFGGFLAELDLSADNVDITSDNVGSLPQHASQSAQAYLQRKEQRNSLITSYPIPSRWETTTETKIPKPSLPQRQVSIEFPFQMNDDDDDGDDDDDDESVDSSDDEDEESYEDDDADSSELCFSSRRWGSGTSQSALLLKCPQRSRAFVKTESLSSINSMSSSTMSSSDHTSTSISRTR